MQTLLAGKRSMSTMLECNQILVQRASYAKNISAYNCDYFLIHQFKHVFWSLKRTVTLRRENMGKYIKMNGLQVLIVVFPDHFHLLFLNDKLL